MALTLPGLRPWIRPCEALRLLLSGATVRTCLPVALVVGTVLSLVHQGDVVVQATAGLGVVLKVLAHYALPFLTSSTGALLAVRRRSPPRGDALAEHLPTTWTSSPSGRVSQDSGRRTG